MFAHLLGYAYLCRYIQWGELRVLLLLSPPDPSGEVLGRTSEQKRRGSPRWGFKSLSAICRIGGRPVFKLTNLLIMKIGTTKPRLPLYRNLFAAPVARSIPRTVTTQPQQSPLKNIIRSPE